MASPLQHRATSAPVWPFITYAGAVIALLCSIPSQAAAQAATVQAKAPLAASFCGNNPKIKKLIAAIHDPNGRILIAAHRGGHLQAPENSLAAVDEAVAAGADIIELDVKVSADGVPFIMHDQSVDRTTNGHGNSEAFTYAEIRQLRLKGSNAPPPTLLEMLQATCGRILVDLDMKTSKVGPVVAVIQGLKMLDQVMLFDSDDAILRQAQAMAPNLQIMPRLTTQKPIESLHAGLQNITVVHGDPLSLTPSNSAAIRAVPARIWANSLGQMDELIYPDEAFHAGCTALKDLRAAGVNIIQTDIPAILRKRLKSCSIR